MSPPAHSRLKKSNTPSPRASDHTRNWFEILRRVYAPSDIRDTGLNPESRAMTDPVSATDTHFLLRLEALIVRAMTLLLTVVFALIFVMVTTLVIMRYGFNSTVVGGSEATVMLFIYTTALGSAVEIAKGKHIRIDSLVGTLPARWRKGVEMLQLVLVGILHAFLFYFSLEWIRVVGNSKDPVLHTPEWIVEIAIPIGCALAVLFCVTRLFSLALTAPQTAE